MKKNLFALLALIFLLPALLFAGSVEYTKLDVAGWRGTHYLNGDFIMYQSTPTATTNFEVKSGSITKCSSISVTNGITAATGGLTTLTATNATMTGVTITTMTVSSGTVTEMSAGTLSVTGMTNCRLTIQTDVTGGSGGVEKLVFSTSTYDTFSEFNNANSTFTVANTGRYDICGQICFTNGNSPQSLVVRVYVNGVLISQSGMTASETITNSASVGAVPIFWRGDLVAGNKIHFMFLTDSGANIVAKAGNAFSYVWITKIPY